MGALVSAAFFVLVGSMAQSAQDPDQMLREADRLAWLRAWTSAEPQFLRAQRLFAARGDDRNALYAEISAFRGSLASSRAYSAAARREPGC